MIKSLLGTASLAALISTSAIAQTYTAPAGSDYANHTTEVYTEDAMNEFLSMANSFACIQKNARGDLAALANSTWEASINEVDCGLAQANEQGAGNGMARAVMMSSRASSTSPQETTAWFDSSGGGKFVSSMNITKSPADFAPYGAWYVSYRMAKNPLNAGTNTEFSFADQPQSTASGGTPVIGMVDISNPSGTKVLIQSAERSQGGGTDHNETIQSKIEYTDSTLNSATMLGKFGGKDDGGTSLTRIIAGRTSDSHYYRVGINSANGNVTSTACLLRGAKWSSVNRYDVFNKVTGKKVSLDGAFGFEYGAAGAEKRGWFDLNGAWFDKGAFAFNDSTNKTLAVKNQEETDFTLTWAPGNLYKKTAVTETLTTGDYEFTAHVPNGDRVTAKIVVGSGAAILTYYDSAGNAVTDPWDDGNRAGGRGFSWGNTIEGSDMVGGAATGGWKSGYEHMGWMYSEEKRQNIYWNGNLTITVDVQTSVSDNATLLAANHTFLVQDGSEGILAAKMPVNLTAWEALNPGTGRGYINGKTIADDGNKTSDAATFYFTGLAPTGFAGIMPRTLYIDTNDNGPDNTDMPVMFDFARHEQASTFEDFANSKFTNTGSKWGYNDSDTPQKNPNGWNWPQSELNLRTASGVTPVVNYRWNFGANGWDQSVVALTAAGVVKPLDQPLMLTYEHTTAKDLNTIANDLTFFANTQMHTPAPGLCIIQGGGPLQNCTVKADSFNGKKFVLEYNGSNLNGFPRQMSLFTPAGSAGNHVALVNPKDGETLLGNDGVNYVLKATDIGTSFIPAPTGTYNPLSNPLIMYDPNIARTTDCDDLSFDSLADLGTGWTVADLPVAHTPAGRLKWPQSSALWSNLPVNSLLKCSVSKGIPSGCE